MRHALPALLTLIACAAVPDVAAQDAPARTITVTGTGEATAAPDVATMRFSVVSRAQGAADALAANAETATAVRDRLRELGVEPRDMQTSGLSLGPYYEQRDRSGYDRSEIAGYEARNALMVRLRDLDEAGAVIDAAVATGANGLDELSFGIEAQDALLSEARRDAVADARAAAELLADAADASLGEVVSVDLTGGGAPRPAMMRSDMLMESAPATPIEGGEQTVTANVRVVYELN